MRASGHIGESIQSEYGKITQVKLPSCETGKYGTLSAKGGKKNRKWFYNKNISNSN
jgi:hypothetical protein